MKGTIRSMKGTIRSMPMSQINVLRDKVSKAKTMAVLQTNPMSQKKSAYHQLAAAIVLLAEVQEAILNKAVE